MPIPTLVDGLQGCALGRWDCDDGRRGRVGRAQPRSQGGEAGHDSGDSQRRLSDSGGGSSTQSLRRAVPARKVAIDDMVILWGAAQAVENKATG